MCYVGLGVVFCVRFACVVLGFGWFTGWLDVLFESCLTAGV